MFEAVEARNDTPGSRHRFTPKVERRVVSDPSPAVPNTICGRSPHVGDLGLVAEWVQLGIGLDQCPDHSREADIVASDLNQQQVDGAALDDPLDFVELCRNRRFFPGLEEAAMDLGGKPLRVLFDITLPLIAPAMIAGWLLAFTLSLDDLVIASFVSGPGSSTLPMVIFSKVKLGVTPDINALATLIILFVSVSVILAFLAARRAQRQTEKHRQTAAKA